MRRAAAPLLLLLAGCCGGSPEDIPRDEDWLVVVKSARLPESQGTVPGLAHHTWFEIKKGDEQSWTRIEVIARKWLVSGRNVVKVRSVSADEVRRVERWGRTVCVHRIVTGEDAQAMAPELEALAAEYEDSHIYRAWAGPNSNTFTDLLGRDTWGLRFETHHNAIGKDYAPFLRLGPTTTGTGLCFDTWLVGVQLGLVEGVELHFLQLTFGVSIFPPALKLPFLPRLGFPSLLSPW